jgi:hypothetical protein
MLTIAEQYRYRNQGFTKKLNRGLDTETYHGYVKLICDDEGNYKEIDDFEQIIQFLTRERFRNNFNWFYNIKFDFESIIKYLDKDQLIELYTNGKLELWGIYVISYIDKKFFSISLKKNSRFYFYDMFGFLETSLNNASLKYLGEEKRHDIVDSARLNTDLKYWKDNRENIITYCIKDANLTKRVADYFWDLVYKNMDYYPKRPFSKGKIAEEYFMAKCFIPTINDIPKKALEFSYNSYLGGRFELLQKGYFPKCYSYDIKSAYPRIISELIDYNKGHWYKYNGRKINKDAYSGYYLCSINCLEHVFSPFTKRIGTLSVYPNGKFKQYLTKDEIIFFRDNFNSVDIKILDGVEFVADELLTPFREEILKLYTWKEREKDEDVKYAVKIFMNAFYGKTIQKSGELNLTGKVFNPMWATEITSKTRLKLFALMLQDVGAIIGTSTDSVHATKPLSIPKSPALGEFSLDFTGEGVYVMSDVYYLWNNELKKDKNKLRGFSLAKTKDMQEESEREDNKKEHLTLKQILEKMKGTQTEWKYETKRPFHLGECLREYNSSILNRKISIEDLNVFSKNRKSIKINGDKKRIWDSQFKNGKDCLKRNIQSMPINIK